MLKYKQNRITLYIEECKKCYNTVTHLPATSLIISNWLALQCPSGENCIGFSKNLTHVNVSINIIVLNTTAFATVSKLGRYFRDMILSLDNSIELCSQSVVLHARVKLKHSEATCNWDVSRFSFNIKSVTFTLICVWKYTKYYYICSEWIKWCVYLEQSTN